MRNPKARLLASFAVAALGLSAAHCGGSGGAFSFALYMDGAAPQNLASWQVAMLKSGSKSDCTTLESTCLKAQVTADKLVPLTDGQGHEHPAVTFPAQVSGSGTQDVSVTAAVGTDYTLIIEALSNASPPQLLGTSCTRLPEGIHSGANPTVLAEPLKVNATPPSCDPRWE